MRDYNTGEAMTLNRGDDGRTGRLQPYVHFCSQQFRHNKTHTNDDPEIADSYVYREEHGLSIGTLSVQNILSKSFSFHDIPCDAVCPPPRYNSLHMNSANAFYSQILDRN